MRKNIAPEIRNCLLKLSILELCSVETAVLHDIEKSGDEIMAMHSVLEDIQSIKASRESS